MVDQILDLSYQAVASREHARSTAQCLEQQQPRRPRVLASVADERRDQAPRRIDALHASGCSAESREQIDGGMVKGGEKAILQVPEVLVERRTCARRSRDYVIHRGARVSPPCDDIGRGPDQTLSRVVLRSVAEITRLHGSDVETVHAVPNTHDTPRGTDSA
jgi:hypothetical protein